VRQSSLLAARPLRVGVAVAVAAAVFAASVVDPGAGAARTLLGVGVTTYLHVLAYAALAAAVGYARLAADPRSLLAAAALAVAFGSGVELVQGRLPYRTASAADVAVNAVGASAGALLWRLLAPRVGVTVGGRTTTPLSGSTD